jgi:hypothetical protein
MNQKSISLILVFLSISSLNFGFEEFKQQNKAVPFKRDKALRRIQIFNKKCINRIDF